MTMHAIISRLERLAAKAKATVGVQRWREAAWCVPEPSSPASIHLPADATGEAITTAVECATMDATIPPPPGEPGREVFVGDRRVFPAAS